MTTDQPNKPEMNFWKDNGVAVVLLVIMAAFVAWMFYMMTQPNQTPRDAALEAIILTAASIIASYLITKIFAERSYNKSLRDHGVQIASGIMVLKRQMEGLTDWIGLKRAGLSESGKSNQPAEAILEHVEQTLIGFRGMTDTALGGIAGVIGDALAQYETVMEQVSTIRSEALQKTTQIQQEMQSAATTEEVARLQTQMNEIALKTEKEIAKLARSSALPIAALPPKRTYTGKCPYCRSLSAFEMTDRPGETQVIPCDICGKAFNAHLTAGQTVVTRPLTRKAIQGGEAEGPLDDKDRLGIHDCWVSPEQLQIIIPMAIKHDDALKRSDQPRTPFNLQALIFDDAAISEDAVLSKSAVRRFLRMVYTGRGFIFEPGQRAIFKSPYINEITANGMLRAFLHSAIFKIYTWRFLTEGDAFEISKLLLDGKFDDGESLVLEAIEYAQSRLSN